MVIQVENLYLDGFQIRLKLKVYFVNERNNSFEVCFHRRLTSAREYLKIILSS